MGDATVSEHSKQACKTAAAGQAGRHGKQVASVASAAAAHLDISVSGAGGARHAAGRCSAQHAGPAAVAAEVVQVAGAGVAQHLVSRQQLHKGSGARVLAAGARGSGGRGGRGIWVELFGFLKESGHEVDTQADLSNSSLLDMRLLHSTLDALALPATPAAACRVPRTHLTERHLELLPRA